MLKELAEQTPDYDVLVVSDGSTDRTVERGATAAGVHVAVLPFNIGIGGAFRTGFAFAVRRGYERAVQFDADGQHDPSPSTALLDGLDRGADMVIGSRFAEGGAVTYSVSGVRRRAMQVLQWLVKVLVRQRFTDTSSGFRAFSRPMLEYFAAELPGGVHGLGRGAGAGLQRGFPGGRGAGEHARPHRRRAEHPQLQARLLLRAAAHRAPGVDDQSRAAGPSHREP